MPEIGEAIAATKPDVALITGWYSVTLVRALHACRRLGIPALVSGRLASPQRAARLAAAGLGAQDALSAEPIRRVSLAGPARQRIPQTIRRARVSRFQRAARGGQCDVPGNCRTVSGAGSASRGAPRVGHRSRGVRRPVRRQAHSIETPVECRSRAHAATGQTVDARRRLGAARCDAARGSASVGRRTAHGRLPEPDGIGPGLRDGRLPRAAKRLSRNVGAGGQRSARDRAPRRCQRRGRLCARSGLAMATRATSIHSTMWKR